MGLFEQTYTNFFKGYTSFVNESTDPTTEIYGYSLKTFVQEELGLFEAFADAIIKNAQQHKQTLISSAGKDSMMDQYGLMLSITDDGKYIKVKRDLRANPILNIGLREFYEPSIINLGLPSLRYLNQQFFLKFRLHYISSLDLPTLIEESEWKKDIIKAIKFFVTNSFYDVLDCVDKTDNPLSKDLKTFFDWRENKLKISNLTNKLPELKEIFENTKSNNTTKEYVVEVTIKKDSQQKNNSFINQLLEKTIRLFDIYYRIPCTLSETTDDFVFTSNVRIHLRSQKEDKLDYENAFLAYFTQEHKHLIANNKSIAFNLPEPKFKWTDSSFYQLVKKIPELDNLFENKSISFLQDYNLIPPTKLKNVDDFNELWMGYDFGTKELADKTIKMFYEFIGREQLDKFGISIVRLESPTQLVIVVKGSPAQFERLKQRVEVSEIGDSLANQTRGVIDNLYYAIDHESRVVEDFYKAENVIRQECLFLGIKTKFSNLTKKLPELNGVFESKGQSNYQFIATFEPTVGADHKRLLTILKDLTEISKAINSRFGTEEEIVEIISKENGQIVFTVENPVKWDFEKEADRNSYARAFNNSYKAMSSQFNLRVNYTARFKSKYEDMVKKLPELEGIFESKNEYVGFLKLTFKNISKEDMDIILKYGQESMNPHLFEIKPVSDSSMSFIEKAETEEAYEWFIKEIKNHLLEYKHSLASSLYNAAWTPIKNFRQAQAFVKRIFKECEAKVMRSEYENLVKKLPELEGILESQEHPYGLPGFENTNPKSKFQVNDVVKIIDPSNRWSVYQSKKSTEAINQFGTIVGRKYNAGAYSKYAVKLANGNIYSIHSHFLKFLSDDERNMQILKKKLPELTGIFESSNSSETVDVIVHLKQTDNKGNKITKEIQEVIAKYLQKHNCINIEDTWECKVKPWFQYKIETTPPQIIFLDIPKKLSAVYLLEMKETAFFADRVIGSELGQDYHYNISGRSYYNDITIDDHSPALRKLTSKLPELTELV